MRDTTKARIEEFRQLTREQGMNMSAAARAMGISSTCAKTYDKTITEQTGETRAQCLFRRWRELVDSGLPKTQAAQQVGISRTTYHRWETRGEPSRRKLHFPEGSTARARAAQHAQREDRIEEFGRLTREQGISMAAAARAMGISISAAANYERALTQRTGTTRAQHLRDRLQKLPEAGPDTQTEPGMHTSSRNFEARLEQFRILTRDHAKTITQAARELGVDPNTGSVYEKVLTSRTGLTRAQHLHRRCRDLIDQGLSQRKAAAHVGVPLGTLRLWERNGGPRTRTNPDIAAQTRSRAAATTRAKYEERLEAYRHLTRDKWYSRNEACAELGVTSATGTQYERELTRRTGLTGRQHRMAVYRELREFLPRPDAAAFVKILANTAWKWDVELGLTQPRKRAS